MLKPLTSRWLFLLGTFFDHTPFTTKSTTKCMITLQSDFFILKYAKYFNSQNKTISGLQGKWFECFKKMYRQFPNLICLLCFEIIMLSCQNFAQIRNFSVTAQWGQTKMWHCQMVGTFSLLIYVLHGRFMVLGLRASSVSLPTCEESMGMAGNVHYRQTQSHI